VKGPAFLLVAAVLAMPLGRAQAIHGVTEASFYTHVVDGKVVGPISQAVEETLKTAQLNDYAIGLFPWARAYQLALREPPGFRRGRLRRRRFVGGPAVVR
jgi:polar amino acid transport system substrate-binding protein